MARMSLDTAIRLSAEVKGGGNIDRVKKSLQDLGKNSQVSARDMRVLRAATFQFARANDSTIAGIRSSIGAFRGLQEQARIGSREFQRYGAEIQRLEAKLKGLDGTATVTGRSLGQQLAAGLAAAGIGRGLQQITAQAGRFDAELRKAAAIEGGAGSFGVLRKEIESVAAAAAGTPTEVAALATALSRAGFSADQTAKALRGIVLGAEATDTAFADMGGIVGTVLKTFQVDASQTSSIVDVLVKSANSANQTVLDVGEAMSYAAGTASKLNVSVEDTAALIALFADAGVRASRAGTSLSTGLNRLQIAAGGGDSEMQNLVRGSQKMIDAMSALGSQVLDTNGKLKPLDQTLIALKRQMDTLNATDRAILAKAIFGEEAGRSFESVLARSEQDIVRMFGKMRDAGGTAQETQKKMQGFDYSIKVLGGNVENLTNQIGGMIGAALKPLIDGLNIALSATAGLPDPIKALGAGAAAAGITVLGLAVAINAVNASLVLFGGASGVKAAIAGLLSFKGAAALATKAAVALNLAVLGPWALVAAGLIAATAAAYKFNQPFKEFVDTIPQRFNVFWRSIGSDAEVASGRMKVAFDAAAKFIASGIRQMAADQRELQGESLRIAQVLSDGMKWAADSMGINFSSAFNFIQERWKGVVANMINFSNPLLAILKGIGIDVGAAAMRGMTTDQQRLVAAGSQTTYTSIGSNGEIIVYDAATSRPISNPAPFVPRPATVPGAPSAPARPTPAGGGDGAAAKTRSIEEIIAARPFGREILAAAKANNVDPALFAALVEQESGNRQTAISRSGAIGLSQLMPGTARELGVDPYNAMQNLMGGARYLRQQLDRFGLEGGLRAYNQGPGAQQRTPGGNSQESREYPGRVLERYRSLVGDQGDIEGLTAQGIQAQTQAAEQLREQQAAAKKELEDFVKTRTQGILKLEEERELLNATTDIDRRRLEYEFEQSAIQERFKTVEEEALERRKRIAALGLDYNVQEEQALISSEKQAALDNARVKAEQDINRLIAERIRLAQSSAAGPAAFDMPQDVQIESNINRMADELREMTSIATLAGRSAETIGNAFGNAFRDLISGAANARQVLAGFFEDVAQGFAQMAAEIIAKQMTMIALQMILKALGAVAGGGFAPTDVGPFGAGGMSTSLSFDPSAMIPRALGGPVSPGRPYPVGEQGPELFVPYQAGSIIPAEATEALEAINNASLRGLQVPFQNSSTNSTTSRSSSSSSTLREVPFQRGMEGLSVPFQRGGDAGGVMGGGGSWDSPIRFESVVINSEELVTRKQAEEIGRRSEQRGAALAQKRIVNNTSTRRQAGIG